MTAEPTSLSVEEYAAILRQDFATFMQRCFYELHPGDDLAWNWHLDILASKLTDVANGKIKRLIVNLPPRQLKSEYISIALPAWIMGRKPNAKFMCVSYGEDLAEDFARRSLHILSTRWFKMAFPTRLGDHRAVRHFNTTQHGYRRSTSVQGATTGFGADFVIVDDPQKPIDAASEVMRDNTNIRFDNALYTRLNNKTDGAIIIVMQRVHQEDLVGYVLSQAAAQWEVLSLPAIATDDEHHTYENAFGGGEHNRAEGEALHPERESLEVLLNVKAQMREAFEAQYQQSPQPPNGAVVDVSWFQRFDPQSLPEPDRIFQSWDTASKDAEINDYSVCTTWAQIKKHLYLLNVFRKRLTFANLVDEVLNQAALFEPGVVVVEDTSSGTHLLDILRQRNFGKAVPFKVEGTKVMRMQNQAGLIQNGFVHIPQEAHWLNDFLKEMASFPRGIRFDDQVDSVSQALGWFAKQSSEPSITTRYRLDAIASRAAAEAPKAVLMRAPSGFQGSFESGGGAGDIHRVGGDVYEATGEMAVATLLKLGFQKI